MEIDFFYKLTNPFFSLKIAIPIILIMALITYYLCKRNIYYKKRLGLVAELLVLFGIVGVFGLIGKVRNDTLNVQYEKLNNNAKYELDVAIYSFNKLCRENLKVDYLICGQYREAIKAFEKDQSYQFFIRDFREILINNRDLNIYQTFVAYNVVNKGEAYLEIVNLKAIHEIQMRDVSLKYNWQLILIGAFFVAAGMGVKIGRAYSDL